MKLFKKMTAKQLKAADKFFTGGGAAKVAVRFENWVANHIALGFQTGDATHFNTVLAGAREFKRYRFVKRVFCGINISSDVSDGLIPFDYDTAAEAFVGKIEKQKRDLLIEPAEYKDADGNLVAVQVWEKHLRMALDNEQAAEKTSSKSEFNLSTSAKAFYQRARKAGASESQINAAIAEAMKLTRQGLKAA